MKLSKTRWWLRVLLLLLVPVVGLLVYRAWQTQQPRYVWEQAEAAIAAGEPDRAELHLKTFLSRNPRHGAAHFQLAEVKKQQAEQADRKTTHAIKKEGLAHLAQAAELLPDDVAVQTELMSTLAQLDRHRDAAKIANRVRRLDPNSAEASLWIARQSLIEHDFLTVRKALDTLKTHEHTYPFTESFLAVELARKKREFETQQTILTKTFDRIDSMPVSDLGKLPAEERRSLVRLFVYGVALAQDAQAAHRNAQIGVDRLVATDDLNNLARVGHALRKQFPIQKLDESLLAPRQALESQIETVAARAAEKHNVPLTVSRYLAETQIATGNHDRAITILADALRLNTKRPGKETRPLHLLLARELMTQRRFAEAEQHTAPLLADAGTSAAGHMIAGSIALADGRHEHAVPHFLSARDLLGNTIQVRLALASCYAALARWDEAAPQLEAALQQLDPLTETQNVWATHYIGDGQQLRLLLVQAHLEREQPAAAAPHIAALRGTPQYPHALLLRARFAWKHGQTEEVARLLSRARGEHPDDVSLLLTQAALQSHTQGLESATQLVRTFAEKQPDNLSHQMALMNWHVSRGAPQTALAMLPQLRTRFGDRTQFTLIEAQLQLASGLHHDASATSAQLRKSPESEPFGLLLGAEAALQLGQSDAAAHLLHDHIKGIERTPQLAFYRARAAAAAGRHDEALDRIVPVLNYSVLARPASSLLYASLTQIATKQGPQSAFDKTADLLKKHPNEPSLILAQANLALQLDQGDLALSELDRLVRLKPDWVVASYTRSRALLAAKQRQSALQELDRAVTLDKEYLPALKLRTALLIEEKRFEEALAQGRAMSRLRANDPWLMLLTGESLAGLSRYDEALSLFRQAIVQEPKLVEAHLNIAACYRLLGRPEQARAALRYARRQLPTEFRLVRDELRVVAELDQPEVARTIAEEAIKANPALKADTQLAWCFFRLGQHQLARDFAELSLTESKGASTARFHWVLGTIEMTDGARQKNDQLLRNAQKHFESILVSHPQHFGALNNLTYLLSEHLNRPQEALVWVENIRANQSVNEMPLTLLDTLATVYRQADQPAQAKLLLVEATQVHPDSANLWFHLGMTHHALGEHGAARRSLEKALELGITKTHTAEAHSVLDAIVTAPANN